VTTLYTTLLTLLTYLTAIVSMQIPFLSLFLVLGGRLTLLGSRPLSAANGVSHSKIYVSNPSYLSLTVSRMKVDSEIYDRWLWTVHNWGLQSFYLMYQKCLAALSHRNTLNLWLWTSATAYWVSPFPCDKRADRN